MRATLREMRRAPVRIVTSIVAIALAIAAIGVFAVPGVAANSLRDVAAQDTLTHLSVRTAGPITEPAGLVDEIAALPGVELTETRVTATLPLPAGSGAEHLTVVGAPTDDTINSLRLTEGRPVNGLGEVVAAPALTDRADEITALGCELGTCVDVVGIGDTTYWAEYGTIIYTGEATALALTGMAGPNSVVVRLADPTTDNLHAMVDQLRPILADHGTSLASFTTIPDGIHPIEEDIEQISFMIGSLGVVAGIVALILLSSTTNAIVVERTRDAAVMRALGATRREVRRDLRRLAVTIGVIGTALGLPLGIVVANVVARMVLTRFAGITPDVGVDIIVTAAAAAFGIIGARIVSARVARKVARADLVSALRDRDAAPFGRRLSDRLLTKVPTGGLTERIALRAIARRRSRSLAVTAQIAGAVAAAVLVASLGSSIADFNGAELASYRWETTTRPIDPVYPFDLDTEAAPPGSADTEVALRTEGDADGWDIELFGVDPATTMVDTGVSAGQWLPATVSVHEPLPPAVLAKRFADQLGYELGDTITVDLVSGPAEYRIVGLHPVKSVAMYVDAHELADNLGTGGAGNIIWAGADAALRSEPTVLTDVATTTVARDELFADDAAARDAILGIFATIGAIVVSIGALGVASTVMMNLYERRAEIAAVQSIGARRGTIRRMLLLELGLLAAVGWALGSVAGYLGANAIMGYFADANAIDLGFTMAWSAVPVAAVASLVFCYVLARAAAARAQAKPLAATLRAAT